MGSAAHQSPTITIHDVAGSFNVWNNYGIPVGDEEKKHQILEWLSPLAPRERHRAVSEGRVDGVGKWLLRTSEFEKWHTNEDQTVNPVLFCYGDPGVGKTYLSSLVIDTLCDAIDGDNVAVACVYCDFHAHKEQSAAGVLAALLKQLVTGVEPIPEEITEAFERAKKEVGGRALQLLKIRAMLVRSLSSLQRGFICIDALDEFPTKNRPELWDSLRHILRECSNTRLFITGRPYIRDEAKKYFPGYLDLILIKPTEEDIRGYVTMRLKKDSELDAMDTELKAEILRIILDKISGAFLLVSLIMDAVLKDATIHQRRQTLHRMTNGLGLDNAYSTTLGRIGEQGGNKVKLGMEALMWISRSERPLKAEELCHALAVEIGTTDLNVQNVPSTRTLLSCTLGLVTIDEQASTVRFTHFTLQEYLAAHPNLFTTPHSMMAEICLTYLNFQLICGLSSTLDPIPSTAPFLHYASCYWGFHARKEMTEGVKHLALRLLQRDANHISVDILLRQLTLESSPRWDCQDGRNPDSWGFTGLHCIAYMGITEIATDMVKMERWDLNGRDWNGETPLIWTIKYGNYRLAKLLLEQGGVNPILSDKQGLTPLIHAAKAGQEGAVKLLLERADVNPNSPDMDGRTPLSYATESGHKGVVKALLQRLDFDPDSSNKYGRSSLLYAPGYGHGGLVKTLLGRGDVNPDSSDSNGQRPLLLDATMKEREGPVRLLSDSRTPNCESSENRDRMPISVTHRNASRKVAHPLTATKPHTLRTMHDPYDISLAASFYPPSLYSPLQEKTVRLEQSPPIQLRPLLAPYIPISAPGSGSAFPFLLWTLILIIFLFFLLMICHG